MAEEDVWESDVGFWKEGRVPFSLSEEIEFVLLAPRVIPARPSAGFRDLELVLGRRVLRLSSSKHDVQPAGRASVTIKGVGPCFSQKTARHKIDDMIGYMIPSTLVLLCETRKSCDRVGVVSQSTAAPTCEKKVKSSTFS